MSEGTQRMIRLPCVQLIGVQKAGTSSIADWLFDHGGFRRPRIVDAGEPSYYTKEVHFFDDGRRYHQGVPFYAERFRRDVSSDSALTMDATPDTFQFASRVRQTYDAAQGDQAENLKIMVILREPVSRELSLYNHLVFDCNTLDASERTSWHDQVLNDDGSILSFDDFVQNVSIPALLRDDGPGMSTRHGLYANHLARWFHFFDRRQILVMSYDELQHNPRRLQERIQSFLGIDVPGELQRSNSNDHDHKVRVPSETGKSALNEIFCPHNERLYRLLEEHRGPPEEQKPFPRFS
jgi:hypothetical protein